MAFHHQLRCSLVWKKLRLHALGVSIGKIDRPVRYGMLSVPRNPEGVKVSGVFQEMNRKFNGASCRVE